MTKLHFSINRKGLQWQLLSRFFLILIVLFVIFGITQYITMSQYLYHDKAEDLQSRFHNINLKSMTFINSNDAVIDNSEAIVMSLVGPNIGVSIIDNNGNVVTNSVGRQSKEKHDDPIDDDNISKSSHPLVVPKFSSEDYLKIMRQEGNLEHTYSLARDENNNLQMVEWRKIGDMISPSGLIQLSIPVNDVQSILYRQLYIYLGGLVLILIFGSLLGGTVFKRTLNPLYNMTKTVENITVGELNTRLPEDNGLLEIDKLSQSFNKMLTGIEISFENEQRIREKMRQFVSNASHELRTPLTSIHGFVEVLLRGAAKNELQLNTSLKTILLESERLTKLVQDLLMITRLDQRLPIEMCIQNISIVIMEVFPQLQILAGDRHIELNLKDDILVKINKDQIKQVIFNLVNNAVQHTDGKSGIIKISTDIDEVDSRKFAVMSVADNGAGIPEKHIDKIFDRFFRSEFHRSREHGGYGLGLSIVKSIIEAHGGKITVKSMPGSGTTFTVYLTPLLNES